MVISFIFSAFRHFYKDVGKRNLRHRYVYFFNGNRRRIFMTFFVHFFPSTVRATCVGSIGVSEFSVEKKNKKLLKREDTSFLISYTELKHEEEGVELMSSHLWPIYEGMLAKKKKKWCTG